jgi:spermidine/putrescine transport system permease protein
MFERKTLAQRRRLTLTTLLFAPTTFLFVFFLCPLAIMVVYSWLKPGLYGGVDWSFSSLNYGRIFGWADAKYEKFDPVYVRIFLQSIFLAFTTAVLSLLICYPAAFWVCRLPAPQKNFALFLITLPFFISLIVRLFAWVLILRPTGILNQALMWLGLVEQPLEIIFTRTAVVIGMVYVYVPFMFLPLYASIDRLDFSLIEASQDLGAKWWQTFFRVIFPLTLPGIAGGSIIVFIPSLGNFIVPSVLGGAKVLLIGNLIEQQFLSARNWPFGAALGMMVMAAVLFLLMYYLRIIAREENVAKSLNKSERSVAS